MILKTSALLKSLGISKLYLYGRGTNLWTKTYDKRLPFDPEVGINGLSNLEVPQVENLYYRFKCWIIKITKMKILKYTYIIFALSTVLFSVKKIT